MACKWPILVKHFELWIVLLLPKNHPKCYLLIKGVYWLCESILVRSPHPGSHQINLCIKFLTQAPTMAVAARQFSASATQQKSKVSNEQQLSCYLLWIKAPFMLTIISPGRLPSARSPPSWRRGFLEPPPLPTWRRPAVSSPLETVCKICSEMFSLEMFYLQMQILI